MTVLDKILAILASGLDESAKAEQLEHCEDLFCDCVWIKGKSENILNLEIWTAHGTWNAQVNLDTLVVMIEGELNKPKTDAIANIRRTLLSEF